MMSTRIFGNDFMQAFGKLRSFLLGAQHELEDHEKIVMAVTLSTFHIRTNSNAMMQWYWNAPFSFIFSKEGQKKLLLRKKFQLSGASHLQVHTEMNIFFNFSVRVGLRRARDNVDGWCFNAAECYFFHRTGKTINFYFIANDRALCIKAWRAHVAHE